MVTLDSKMVSELCLALRLHKESKEKLARLNRDNKNKAWYEADVKFIESIESLLAELSLEVMSSPTLTASLEVKL